MLLNDESTFGNLVKSVDAGTSLQFVGKLGQCVKIACPQGLFDSGYSTG